MEAKSKSVQTNQIMHSGFSQVKSSIASLSQSLTSKNNIPDTEENAELLQRKIDHLNETLNQTKAQVAAYDAIYNNAYNKCKVLEKENIILQNASEKYNHLKKLFIAFLIATGVIIVVMLIIR